MMASPELASEKLHEPGTERLGVLTEGRVDSHHLTALRDGPPAGAEVVQRMLEKVFLLLSEEILQLLHIERDQHLVSLDLQLSPGLLPPHDH